MTQKEIAQSLLVSLNSSARLRRIFGSTRAMA